MRLDRRAIWTLVTLVVVAVASLLTGMHLAAPSLGPDLGLVRNTTEFRAALERYRADHGWYPGDPDRDWNSDGRPDVVGRQLTGFTRDDGKPADSRDTQYCFGPYLAEIPTDPVSGSRAIVVDQDRARALARLRRDVGAGIGRGGWYYEARTGNVVPNHGRGRGPRYAGL